VAEDTDGTTSRFVLKNGLTLLVDESHTVPLAAIHAFVRTGDDPAERPGLARLAGRMLLEAADAGCAPRRSRSRARRRCRRGSDG
jgi:predicted Zn-dependent peptidase